MLLLPHGCKCSQPSIFPKDWNKKGASIEKDWRLQYYFYDQTGKKSHRVVKAGVNRCKTVAERRSTIKRLLDEELEKLQHRGYNPITGKYISIPMALPLLIDPITSFCKALETAASKLIVTKETALDLKSVIKYITIAIKQLHLDYLEIQNVRRKHCKMLLEHLAQSRPRWSAYQHNKYRAYLISIFNYLIEVETCDINPIEKISKQKIIHKLRDTISISDRARIDEHLAVNDSAFRRFIHIFFHSGSRPIELLQMKVKDVNLERQTYKTLVKKGQDYREKLRTIKDIALPLWSELIDAAKPTDYLFGKGLLPGAIPVKRGCISKKWLKLVKKDLGIEADMYSLKHSNLDETSAILDVHAAAAQAGHESTVMVLQHYAVNEKYRQHERLKKVNNPF